LGSISGRVIVGADGDLFGDGINIAVRLEGIADAGGILISEKVYGEIEGKLEVDFGDRGEQQLKNISKPIRAFAVSAGTRGARTETLVRTFHFQTSLPLRFCRSRTCPVIPNRSILPMEWSRRSRRRFRGSNGCS
jgi:hypothetical protein